MMMLMIPRGEPSLEYFSLYSCTPERMATCPRMRSARPPVYLILKMSDSYLMNKLNTLDKLGLPLHASYTASSEYTTHSNE